MMNSKSFNFKNIRTITASLVLLSLLFLPDISFYLMARLPMRLVTGWLLVSSIFLLPITLFRNHVKLYVILLSALGFFALLATIPVFYFGLILNKEVMQLIYNTSYYEASELMKGYLIPVIIAIVIYIGFSMLIVKNIPRTIPMSVTLKIMIASLAIILLFPLTRRHKSYFSDMKDGIMGYYPFYLLHFGRQFYSEIHLAKMHPSLVENDYFNAKQKKQIHKRQIYVFFIGETARYDHWGINGYYRNTSPLLSKEKTLISYNGVCAAGGLTELSVPILMTQTHPDNFDRLFYQKGIFSVFNEAGFQTWWVSNQLDGANVTMFLKDARNIKILENVYDPFSFDHPTDNMELIKYLKKAIRQDTSNLFIVLHSLGSHFAYNYRYPDSFNHFRPSGGKSPLRLGNPKLLPVYINAYDNAIRYNDAVIDSAIQVLKHENAISFLYYIADHGENLDDMGEGSYNHEPVKPTIYIAHIPLFIYTSPGYDSLFPDKVTTLKSHINSRIDGSNTFNTIADMADIQFIGQDTTESFASCGFKDTTRLILGGDGKVYTYHELISELPRQNSLYGKENK